MQSTLGTLRVFKITYYAKSVLLAYFCQERAKRKSEEQGSDMDLCLLYVKNLKHFPCVIFSSKTHRYWKEGACYFLLYDEISYSPDKGFKASLKKVA